LRNRLKQEATARGWTLFVPDFQYCTDNAGMVAMAAWFKWQEQRFAPLDAAPNPRLKIGE
jgi:N6-L-threonylcarbamoyladenine synthase